MERRTQISDPTPRTPSRWSLAHPFRAFRGRLFRNGVYLILSTATSVVLGAGFWLVVARYYPESDLGLAAAFLLVAAFLAGLANLGLGMGMVRFLPGSDQRSDLAGRTVNASLTLSVALAFIFATVYLVGVPLWTPSLGFLLNDFFVGLTFVLVTAVYAVHPLIDSAFLAFRKAKYILARNLLFGLRVPLPILFAGGLGFLGILLASGLGGLFAAAIALFVFLPHVIHHYRPRPTLGLGTLRPLAIFSLGNKAAEIAGVLMITVLPLLIIEVLSAREAAWFYIAWFVGSAIFVIPGAMSMSLFAEGSRSGAQVSRDIPTTLAGSAALMLPAGAILWFFGDSLLSIFGPSYAIAGFELLRWLVLASPFVLANSLYFTLLRVRKRTAPLIAASAWTTALVLIWSYFLLPLQGIVVVGPALLVAQFVVSGVILTWVLLNRLKARPAKGF